MRKAFAVLAAVLAVAVLAQFYFAASGAFSESSNSAGAGEAYAPHHALGYVLFIYPLLMALFGVVARVPGRLAWMTASVAGLTSVQVVIAKLAIALEGSTAAALVFGLHALGGLAIVAVTGLVVRRAMTLASSSSR